MIGIDIDTRSYSRLLKIIRKIHDMGYDYRVFISPSGLGFHIKVNADLGFWDNILLRAFLDDDAYRILFSLKRAYIDKKLGNANDSYDIIFNIKNKKYEKEITQFIPRELPDDEELLKGIADEVEKKVKMQYGLVKCFVTCIPVSDEVVEHVRSVLDDIANADASFRYKVYPSFYKEHDWIVAVFSDNVDTANKRGLLLCKRYFKEYKFRFWVKELKQKVV